MAFLRTYLADRATQTSDAATFRQDLPRTGQVSAIEVGVRITNGATRGTEQIEDAIDRIEVLGNGSFPIISLTGRSAKALAALFLRKRPPRRRTEAASAVQEASFLLPFGFHIWDQGQYLDLSRWQQVQLAITYSPTVSATTFATGTTTFTVKLHHWSQDASPGGAGRYLRAREIFSFTTVAAGDQQILLPTEHPLLGLIVMWREAAIALETDITRLRVLDKIGGVELFNRRTEDAAYENSEELGLQSIEYGRALLGDTDTFDTDINFLDGLTLAPIFVQSDANGIITVMPASFVGDRVTASVSDTADAAASTHFTAAAAARQVQWIAAGQGLPHAIYVPMHDWGRPESAYPAPQRDQSVLLLTQGGAGADVRVNALELAN